MSYETVRRCAIYARKWCDRPGSENAMFPVSHAEPPIVILRRICKAIAEGIERDCWTPLDQAHAALKVARDALDSVAMAGCPDERAERQRVMSYLNETIDRIDAMPKPSGA